MGLLDMFTRKEIDTRRRSLSFVLNNAQAVYDDGRIGLEPTTLTISEKRVAVIGLNGAGKSTLLKLIDGAMTPASGTVSVVQHVLDDNDEPVDGQDTAYDPSHKSDAKALKDIIGIVRREEIPNSYYMAENISAALDAPLKKRKMPDAMRNETIGALFAHFGLTAYAQQKADALDSEKRHLLAIVGALAISPAAIVADEPTKGLDEPATRNVARALFSYDRQVVFATHDLTLVTDPIYAIDRVLVLDEHRVVFDGAPNDAVDHYNDLIRERYERMKAGNTEQ
ncbi:energy-coupling factor ABC transporter ATP-binding protein [Bifidobacterium tissieri]|uniref:Energy-coupling factor ABC transporter ATP-binding protein n=1 Tax=Bifidobacterium tissieri TaxID=1630162 RepID=A0A5N0A0Y5_9BIFI|nr:energy-coupling factor ABC transporter ATP-binding protein [Bifidobacterium tissieri]KAA8828703.1 energy-coupling factor ABC transporter ATP-binding protein [Bifidobacterium tissieri]KAA8833329.1 energy-coupling factor ABC transporter ATP-binding protein [Bifidobacterium tissieri]